MEPCVEYVSEPKAGRAVETAVKPPPRGFWWGLLYLSWVKSAERRGTMRGAARMTVDAEKRRSDRSSRRTTCRIKGAAGSASVTTR
jgi:hypothetical protein